MLADADGTRETEDETLAERAAEGDDDDAVLALGV